MKRALPEGDDPPIGQGCSVSSRATKKANLRSQGANGSKANKGANGSEADKGAKGSKADMDAISNAVKQAHLSWSQDPSSLYVDVNRMNDSEYAADAIRRFQRYGILFSNSAVNRTIFNKLRNTFHQAVHEAYAWAIDNNAPSITPEGENGMKQRPHTESAANSSTSVSKAESAAYTLMESGRLPCRPNKATGLLRPIYISPRPATWENDTPGSKKNVELVECPFDLARFPAMEDKALMNASILLHTKGDDCLLQRCYMPPDSWKARATNISGNTIPAFKTQCKVFCIPSTKEKLTPQRCTPPHVDVYGEVASMHYGHMDAQPGNGRAATEGLGDRTQCMIMLEDCNEGAKSGTGSAKNAAPLFFVPGTNHIIPALMRINGSKGAGFIDFKTADPAFMKELCQFAVAPASRPSVVWWQNVVHFETSDYTTHSDATSKGPWKKPSQYPLWRALSFQNKINPGTVAWRVCIGLHSPSPTSIELHHLSKYARIRSKGFKIWSFLANSKHPLVVDSYSQQFPTQYPLRADQQEAIRLKATFEDEGQPLKRFTQAQRWLLGDRDVNILPLLGEEIPNLFCDVGKILKASAAIQ